MSYILFVLMALTLLFEGKLFSIHEVDAKLPNYCQPMNHLADNKCSPWNQPNKTAEKWPQVNVDVY